jgi:predicted DsbA family dithiol-disulfide isomerase
MTLTVDVISDVICPWCYIGKRRLEKAARALGTVHPVQIRWHPFELNPRLPPEGLDRREYRTAKFGSWERSQELDAQVAAAGAGEGIPFAFDRIRRTPNTFDSHRLIWLAGQAGVQDQVVEALFRGYFTEGRDLSDRQVLLDLVVEAGLDRQQAERLLAGDGGVSEVRAAEAEAHTLGVQGVPFFVANHRLALSGAQEPGLFLDAFNELLAADQPAPETGTCRRDPASGEPSC